MIKNDLINSLFKKNKLTFWLELDTMTQLNLEQDFNLTFNLKNKSNFTFKNIYKKDSSVIDNLFIKAYTKFIIKDETLNKIVWIGLVKTSNKTSIRSTDTKLLTIQVLDYKEFIASSTLINFPILKNSNLNTPELLINNLLVNEIDNYGIAVGDLDFGIKDVNLDDTLINGLTLYKIFEFIADKTNSLWNIEYDAGVLKPVLFFTPKNKDPDCYPLNANLINNQIKVEPLNGNNPLNVNWASLSGTYFNEITLLSDNIIDTKLTTEIFIGDNEKTNWNTNFDIGSVKSIEVNRGIAGNDLAVLKNKDKYVNVSFSASDDNLNTYFTWNGNSITKNKNSYSFTTFDKIKIKYFSKTSHSIKTSNFTNASTNQIISTSIQRNDITNKQDLYNAANSLLQEHAKSEIELNITFKNAILDDKNINNWDIGKIFNFNISNTGGDYFLNRNYLIKQINISVKGEFKTINYICNSVINSYQAINFYDTKTNIKTNNKLNNLLIKDNKIISKEIKVSLNLDLKDTLTFGRITYYKAPSKKAELLFKDKTPFISWDVDLYQQEP